jgi:S1-C subfamily serine protease
VRSIEPGSAASQTQLRPNDVITTVNRKAVANLKELRAACKDQATLLLTVRRGETTLIVPLR